jgi:4-amino-4-deoxy-L-arabinose transferase-like glycosyltransferase
VRGNQIKSRLISTPVALVAIVILAAALRLVSLGELPPGFFIDEAAVGVNARLLAQGGTDQYGESFPVFIRALDDYKCPLFIYTMAPLLAVAEPTEAVVRLPAALWGLLAILAAFFLAREVYGSRSCGLLAALFLAVTPWHVHFSRIAWQAITLTVLYPLALLFIFRWFRSRRWGDALLAALLCGATLYTYTVAKLLIAVTVAVVLYGLVRIRARIGDRDVWIFAVVLVVVALPYVSAFIADYSVINHRLKVFMAPAREMPLAYLSHFMPEFLWVSGDANLRHSPGQGLLPYYIAPLLLAGLVDLLYRRNGARIGLLCVFLFVPVLGAFTQDYPHAARTIAWLPIVQIIAAGGLLAFRRLLVERGFDRAWKIARVAVAIVVALSLVSFVYMYWVDYAERSREEWWDGLMPAMRAASVERQPGEWVLTRPNYSHYSYWMLVTDPPPELILENRSQITAGKDRYDPLDSANKYRFLNFMTIDRGRRDISSIPGLWVMPKKVVDSSRLGGVEVVYDGRTYLVLRVAGPVIRKTQKTSKHESI